MKRSVVVYNKMKIRIPEPCHEDWNNMTPKEQGRHCASCDKTVVDFTNMSDRQIAETLQNNVSSCGRFSRYQLDRNLILHSEPQKHFGLLKLAACAILSVNLLNAHGQNPPENWVEVHQVDNPNDNESLPLDFNGIIKFKVTADQVKLDSLQYIHFQLQDFEMRFEQLDSNFIYEFHVPDSILWEQIEIRIISHDSVSTNLALGRKEWLEKYQDANKELIIEFVDFWTIRKTDALLIYTYSEYKVDPSSIETFWYGNVVFGLFAPECKVDIAQHLLPKTTLHPPVLISPPEPIDEEELIDEHSGIFHHKPSPPESKGSLWKVLYYVLFAGIVGFFTRWAYRKSKEKTTDSESEL